MCQVPLVTCILLCYTGDFEVRNNITLRVVVCSVLFEVTGELQRERLCQSHATALDEMDEHMDSFCK